MNYDIYSELQYLRQCLVHRKMELQNDRMVGADMPRGKERSVFHAKFHIKLNGLRALEHRISALETEVKNASSN